MDPDQQLRNLRDFLLVYNRMTEICFQRCSSNFNYRNLTMDEERCVDNCAGKLIRSNHRLMGTYVQLMPRMVQRRMEEMESKAAENAKAAEALASSSAQASPVAQSYGTSPSPLEEPPLLTASVTDDARGSLAKPPAFDTENNRLGSQSATASEGKLPAAAPLTPATEEGWLNNPGKGPSYAASLPQPPIANAQITLESSPPVVMATPKRSSSADGLTVSKSAENPLSSGQQ
ncbi:mitochondrial import inner membrane translocase subunit Tim10 B [Takifugu rubripes]|uniref:Mitochondrial import inner membrane translocase subunit Tim10 B n=1 Tax=Takifugu rubripes TaxID=31033 RepID=A0A3B5KH83_TAKRU|nr:mitochondrial import inner membrane translocase subunit Tim10 B [Takifugu rubripes]|eukprot:XP_011610009.1 PREDICTED: mitochondrial import inner membrane translocase subunit Tim10 B [Takifugu rubripes]